MVALVSTAVRRVPHARRAAPRPRRSGATSSAGIVGRALDPRHVASRARRARRRGRRSATPAAFRARMLALASTSPAPSSIARSAASSVVDPAAGRDDGVGEVVGQRPRRRRPTVGGRGRRRARRRRPLEVGDEAVVGDDRARAMRARAVKRPPLSSRPAVSETTSSSWWASSITTTSCSGSSAPPAARSRP